METDLDGWLYVLKNMSKLDRIPLYLRKPIFERLFNIAEYSKLTAEYSKLTKEEKEMYDTSLKRKWDTAGALEYARREGEEKGIEKAQAKAYAEKLESARGLKKIGLLSNEQIAESLKLPLSVVDVL